VFEFSAVEATAGVTLGMIDDSDQRLAHSSLPYRDVVNP